MALGTVSGDGILTSVDNAVRRWLVYTAAGIYTYDEKTRTEEREWVALTKTAAQTAAETASQSGLPSGAVAAYKAVEDNRTVASYKLTKTITYAATLTRTFVAHPS